MSPSPRFAVTLAALAALTTPSAAHATVTALRWSYTGDCSAVKTHNARPEDVVTLVVGETLDLEVLGNGAPTFAGPLADPPSIVAPGGIAASLVSSTATSLTLRLVGRSETPARTVQMVRVLRGPLPLAQVALNVVARPRIESIRLAIPGAESLRSVKIAAAAAYTLKLTGVGLKDLSRISSVGTSEIGFAEREGVFRLLPKPASSTKLGQVAPANFRWALDSCPVSGSPDAGLDIEIPGGPGVLGNVENALQDRTVICGTEARNAIDGSWCAKLPANAGPDGAYVSAPPFRWRVGVSAGTFGGAFEARLGPRGGAPIDTKTVPFLKPGDTVTFETPRAPARRHVRTDAACPGCFDLGGAPTLSEELRYDVTFSPSP